MEPRELALRQRAGIDERLAAVVVFHVVPAVEQLESGRIALAHRNRSAQPEVIVRNRPGEQKRSRIVPVAVALDDLRARAGDELAEVHLQALPRCRLEADVGLLHIARPVAGLLCAVNQLGRPPATHVNADPIGAGAYSSPNSP